MIQLKSIIHLASVVLALGSGQVFAELNETQSNFFDASFQSWMSGSMSGLNSPEFQESTDRIFHMGNIQSETESAMVAISAEQADIFGSQSTQTLAGQLNTVDIIHTRLKLAANEQADILYADNEPLFSTQRGGGASADIGGKWGLWINSAYGFGDADSTFDQLGYDYDSWVMVIGADYKISSRFIAGFAFDYSHIDANSDADRGGIETDSYTGSFYSSFFVTDEFHLDAVISYGGSNYEIRRKLFYEITTGSLPGTVDTIANGDTGGDQFSFNFNAGYDYRYKGFLITPYANINYLTVNIDSYAEDVNSGEGWAMAFDGQNIDSLTTTLGSQLAYAYSAPFGVIIPQIHAAWHHEFKNNSRTATATIQGDALAQQINIDIRGPDRDFVTLGADVSLAFAHGISTFASYNALVAYRDVNSHIFTLGLRVDL